MSQTTLNEAPKNDYHVISPVFGQIVMFTLPGGFTTVFENARGGDYIREATPIGETPEHWTQMITITGAKGLVAKRNVKASLFADTIAAGFKRACPNSFSFLPLGPTKVGTYDAFAAIASCGAASSGGGAHSETALVLAISGSADMYSLQWAERGIASERPLTLDAATWRARLAKLNPKLCPVKPGEAAPFPSCVNAQ